MDIQKDLLQTAAGDGIIKTWLDKRKAKKAHKGVKGSFNRTTRQRDKHQIKKMNNKAKGYRRCFGFLAEDGTCTKPQSTTT
jgi:hypothetical protein